MDVTNPYMMGAVQTFKGDDTVEEEHNEFLEIVDFDPIKGMVEIGWDGPGKAERRYLKLPLAELVAKAAAFGRSDPNAA